jgi:hypothetical protein
MTENELFAMRDEWLVAHPAFLQMMNCCNWYEWAKRQMNPYRIIEQRWSDGVLVSERDVTPPDPEPEL